MKTYKLVGIAKTRPTFAVRGPTQKSENNKIPKESTKEERFDAR